MNRPSKPLRVLVIPDKFKGTLTADRAAHAIAHGWTQVRPHDTVRTLPLTDGGDGFGDCMRLVLGARRRTLRSIDAAHRPCRVPWYSAPKRNLAVVESARCIGLAMLPSGRYHPFQLDTRGLAVALKSIARHRTHTCLVGIGGSATNDAGFGLALGLGWQFFDRRGYPVNRWIDLPRLTTAIRPPGPSPLSAMHIIVATDVENPLLGRYGATRVYGPQKGILPRDIPPAERAHRQLSSVVEESLQISLADRPGTGAAGGLGFGLVAFAGATLRPGLDLYAHYARLDTHLRWAQLVITGEGRMDRSTLMGKGVGEIGRRARSRHLPCIGIAGTVRDLPKLQRHFVAVASLSPERFSLEQALHRPAYCLRHLARDVGSKFPARLAQGETV